MATDSPETKKTVLFHRDFQQFTGGHMKVWDYFNHTLASASYQPRIAFSAQSKWDETNPWFRSKNFVMPWEPEKADVLFLAGTDWRALLPESQRLRFARPIINLLQHVRHGDPGSEVFSYLRNRAIRICASEAVANAIRETKEVNGPIFVIPYGIDIPISPDDGSLSDRPIDVFIGGLKLPKLARQLEAALAKRGRRIECVTDWMPRHTYLERLRQSKVAVLLARTTEGFYLPALEAMACGAIVVCPDCIGNRHFCHDRQNCFRPRHNPADIISAAKAALGLSSAERKQMRQMARATALDHSMEKERSSFLGILDRVEQLWNEES